jgi:hypothetical protein
LSAVGIHEQQITTVGTESALDCRLHGDTGVDVGDDLTLSLRSIGACISKAAIVSTGYGSHQQNCPHWEQHIPSFNTTIVGVWPLKAMFISRHETVK